MIVQVLKKEMVKWKKTRKLYQQTSAGRVYFKAPDGKYYYNDNVSFSGLKEIKDFCSQKKRDIGTQTKLIE